MTRPLNHDAYIAPFPQDTQTLLQQMREIIKATAPNAVEVISYSMPAFKLNGKMLVWFAGYERHIGFYPGASGIAAFQQEISGFKSAKGSVQFPLDKSLPMDLIEKITKFRMAEIAANIPMLKRKRV